MGLCWLKQVSSRGDQSGLNSIFFQLIFRGVHAWFTLCNLEKCRLFRCAFQIDRYMNRWKRSWQIAIWRKIFMGPLSHKILERAKNTNYNLVNHINIICCLSQPKRLESELFRRSYCQIMEFFVVWVAFCWKIIIYSQIELQVILLLEFKSRIHYFCVIIHLEISFRTWEGPQIAPKIEDQNGESESHF